MLNEWLPIIAIPLVIVLVLIAVFSMWKKVPQDKAGVITGLKRRVITGGGGLVIPGVERIDYISLGNMPLRVDTKGSLSSQGVPISVSTTAVIKVRNSPDAILTAIEQFTGKNEQEIIKNIMSTATAVLEGKLREIIATMTVEDLYQKREAFSSQVQEVVGTELGNMGLEVKNFTITDISDENGYIEALGEGMIAQRKKDAEIQSPKQNGSRMNGRLKILRSANRRSWRLLQRSSRRKRKSRSPKHVTKRKSARRMQRLSWRTISSEKNTERSDPGGNGRRADTPAAPERNCRSTDPSADHAGAEKYRACRTAGVGKGKAAAFRGGKACRGRKEEAGTGI